MILGKRVKNQGVSEEEHDFYNWYFYEPLWCNTSYMTALTFQNHVSFP